MSRADRILKLATERGPQGVSQDDFDYPCADHDMPIDSISTVIGQAGLDLRLVRTTDGSVWYLPAFAPKVLIRTGHLCVNCGHRHPSDREPGPCDECGGFPLIQALVLAPEEVAA